MKVLPAASGAVLQKIMPPPPNIENLFREEAPRVLATLIRLVGDYDRAEDAVQEAFAAALRQWPQEGTPANPRAWLITTARFKAIDMLRKRARLQGEPPADLAELPDWNPQAIEDDTLRLIFTCCHPEIPEAGRVALTLREVCGLTTEEIAKAFLCPPPTIAQRIVRAKGKIRDEKIPYELPAVAELEARLESVLRVVYLVFNEGYYASSGYSLLRVSLSSEAVRLGRLLADLLPHPETTGLLALMLLHESRRATRVDEAGDLVLLPDQDRSRWNRSLIEEGVALSRHAGLAGPYSIQAAISAVHAASPSEDETDWARVVALYDRLANITDSPIVSLNRAVAVAMCDGPRAGLQLIDDILDGGLLGDYPLAHAARADLLRRLNRYPEAQAAYHQALELTNQGPERRFLERRIREMQERVVDSEAASPTIP